MRERHPTTQVLRDRLTEVEVDCIAAIDLYDVMYMLVIRMNRGLITVFAEWWHSETCTFHLAQGEMTITLEDVWRILHIPIRGELVAYDRAWGTTAMQRLFDEDVFNDNGSVAWEDIVALYEPLLVVLSGIAGGLLCLDRRSNGLAVGWSQVIE